MLILWQLEHLVLLNVIQTRLIKINSFGEQTKTCTIDDTRKFLLFNIKIVSTKIYVRKCF